MSKRIYKGACPAPCSGPSAVSLSAQLAAMRDAIAQDEPELLSAVYELRPIWIAPEGREADDLTPGMMFCEHRRFASLNEWPTPTIPPKSKSCVMKSTAVFMANSHAANSPPQSSRQPSRSFARPRHQPEDLRRSTWTLGGLAPCRTRSAGRKMVQNISRYDRLWRR